MPNLAQLLSWVFSPIGLFVAVLGVRIWYWVRHKWGRDGMNTTLLPTLAIVVAGWSYGAQDLSLRLQREQNELALADMRGLLTFEAAHDQDWNITLQKADGEPFEVNDLALIPTYQISRDEGPVDGPSVDVRPSYSARDGNRIIKISNALDTVCRVDNSLCSGNVRVLMLTLDFFHHGKRYRIVANPQE